MHDIVLTVFSRVLLAVASHLSNTLESHEMLHLPQRWAVKSVHGSAEDVHCHGALTLNNWTGCLVKLEWEFSVPGEGWYLFIISSLMALLVCTAKMLQRVYPIGRKNPFPPTVLLCCRLPDCWSIKIIIMEIDLIDNVPCSHCEQLVPCEHNPETSSEKLSSTNFQSLILFCPSRQKMKKGNAGEDKILSCQVQAKQVEMWREGDGLKHQEGQKRQRVSTKRTEDWPKELSHPFPIPENPLLSSVSNRKIPDSGPGSTVPAWLHPTCKPCQERWHLDDPSPQEGDCLLSSMS